MSRLNGVGFRWIAQGCVICLLCAVAVIPLLRTSPPCTHDGSAHYYRVVALREMLQDGVLFTRYLPNLALGYGYPFLNYRAVLPYYLILSLHLLGLGLPLAQNLAYALCIVGSAISMYLLARDLYGPPAGLVAAVAYAYAPYQFLDALLRGNIPESVAFFLMPLILWAFRRLALTNGRHWFLISVLSLSSLYLTHNISSLLFTPLLLAYLIVLALVYHDEFPWLVVGAAFLLALGLTAFFWAPALLERDYVQLHMSYTTRNNDFRQNFIALGEILAPPDPVDMSLMNPPIRVHLGLVQAILAVIGLVAGLAHWRRGERRAHVTVFALVAGVMVWMSTPASRFLWERLPLLRFVQFPWRLVGRAGLPVSLLTGALASVVAEKVTSLEIPLSGLQVRVSHVLPILFVAVLILASFPYTYPPLGYCSRASNPTIEDLFAYEQSNERLGLAASGSFFPIWVEQRPERSPLVEQYVADGPVERFDESLLPAGARIAEAHYGVNSARLVIESPVSFRARYLSFYFPGWRVWIDGEQTEITPSEPEGLITFEVPKGRHTVRVDFGETRLRLAADTVSLLSLIALVVLTVWSPGAKARLLSLSTSLSLRSEIPVVVVALFLLGLKLGVVDQVNTLFRRPDLRRDGSLPGVGLSLQQTFADGLKLIGYDQSTDQMPADGILRVDLYWTTYRQPRQRYQTVVHLVGPNGLRWSLGDSLRPTDYQGAPPTTTWTPERYALDSHEVEPLPATPPGTYDIVLTVFDRDTLAPLSVLNEQLQPAGPELILGQVTLVAPQSSPQPEELDIRERVDIPFGPLTLLGMNFDRTEAAPGDPVFVTVFWRVDEQPAAEFGARLELLAPDGSLVDAYGLPSTVSWHPISDWQPGDVWRGQHLINLPAALGSGEYHWRLSLPAIQRSADLPAVIRVDAPERAFVSPPVDVKLDVRFGDVATLSGASLEPRPPVVRAGETLTTTLVWRAESETDTSYRVFVHLLAPDGRLVDQSDGIPAGWARPTTGWLAGEYIRDRHTLTIPTDGRPGDYAISVGLYGPDGKRLTTLDGAEMIRLDTVTLAPDG
ncbi:MAG: 6-pyruvoyl-tetrahydropterin synthase-related protein [bacterium]